MNLNGEKQVQAHQHGMCMAETMRYDNAQIQIYALYCYTTEVERNAFLAGFKGTKERTFNEFQD